ncbi:substrate-binding domain-containing protein, partial [Megasphaera massiliensis]
MTKHITKSGVMLLVLAFILVLSACSGGNGGGSNSGGKKDSGKDGKIKIGFSLDTLQEERWQKDRDLFKAAAQKLGADVEVLAANSDDAKQIAQAESLISQGVDILVVVPHNAEATAAIVEKAHEAGIKVLAYDRLIKNSDVDLYVSFDNERVGEMQAEAIVAKAPKGKYV